MGWRGGVAMMTAALALSACGKPAEKTAAASPDGTASQATAAASSADEVKTEAAARPALPTRKPGLWEQKVSTSGMQQVTKLCLDKAAEAKMSVWGAQAGKDVCQQTSVTPAAGGGWSFSSSCDMGSGGKTTTEGTVTGDFDASYKVEAHSHTDGAAAPQMNGDHKMAIEATWQGPCPDNMKPGDMLLPGGMKINVLDMAAHRPGMARPAK